MDDEKNSQKTYGEKMKNYWSCSKLADWLRGKAKPHSGSLEEWNIWEKQAKQKSFRYWMAEEGLDYLQNIVYAPMTLLNAIRSYISNRFVVKTHALTSHLKRGKWHEFDTRLLHSIFDELINFVETEFAHQFYIWTTEDQTKYHISWYRKFFRIGFWRCPEAGIDYLHWASQLKHDDVWVDKNIPEYDKPTPQALAAQEILILYQWWKSDRPNRPDPGVASGWSAYCEEKDKEAKARGEDPLSSIIDKDKTDDKRSRELMDICHQMEQQQENEDTAMLIRLIKIRQRLWT
jgi:hypothetical protein